LVNKHAKKKYPKKVGRKEKEKKGGGLKIHKREWDRNQLLGRKEQEGNQSKKRKLPTWKKKQKPNGEEARRALGKNTKAFAKQSGQEYWQAKN